MYRALQDWSGENLLAYGQQFTSMQNGKWRIHSIWYLVKSRIPSQSEIRCSCSSTVRPDGWKKRIFSATSCVDAASSLDPETNTKLIFGELTKRKKYPWIGQIQRSWWVRLVFEHCPRHRSWWPWVCAPQPHSKLSYRCCCAGAVGITKIGCCRWWPSFFVRPPLLNQGRGPKMEHRSKVLAFWNDRTALITTRPRRGILLQDRVLGVIEPLV